MKKYLILVGPSYNRNSGYKVRVDRLNNNLIKNNISTEIYCVCSLKTFFKGFTKTFNKKFDLIMIENIALISIVLLNFMAYSRCVLDYHGSIYDASFRKTFFLRKRLYLFFEFIAAFYFKKIVVISEVFKVELRKKYNILERKDKVITIPNIPNISNNKITQSNDKYFLEKGLPILSTIKLAYLGNNQTWQKIPELLNFVQELNNFIDESVVLTIATNEKDWFTNYIAEHNFNYKIIITLVDKNDLLQFLNEQDFLLMLREENEINKVACPTKAIEYLLSNTPILVSEHLGDISSLVRKNNKGVVLSSQWSNLNNLNKIKKFIKNYKRNPGLSMLLQKNYYNNLLDI